MVVTSRAGAKHRERAMSEGATAFMVKPVQEDQLIASVAQMIGHALPHLAANAAAAGAEVTGLGTEDECWSKNAGADRR